MHSRADCLFCDFINIKLTNSTWRILIVRKVRRSPVWSWPDSVNCFFIFNSDTSCSKLVGNISTNSCVKFSNLKNSHSHSYTLIFSLSLLPFFILSLSLSLTSSFSLYLSGTKRDRKRHTCFLCCLSIHLSLTRSLLSSSHFRPRQNATEQNDSRVSNNEAYLVYQIIAHELNSHIFETAAISKREIKRMRVGHSLTQNFIRLDSNADFPSSHQSEMSKSVYPSI